jgi:hypothetical protein
MMKKKCESVGVVTGNILMVNQQQIVKVLELGLKENNA